LSEYSLSHEHAEIKRHKLYAERAPGVALLSGPIQGPARSKLSHSGEKG
jgi:hypothetical protein